MLMIPIFNFILLVLLFFFEKLELISLVILCISNGTLMYFASKIEDQKTKIKKNTADFNVTNSSRAFTSEDLENQLIKIKILKKKLKSIRKVKN